MLLLGQAAKPVGDGNAVTATITGEDQRITLGGNVEVTGADASAELQRILAGVAVGLDNGVGAVASVEAVGVVAGTAVEGIAA